MREFYRNVFVATGCLIALTCVARLSAGADTHVDHSGESIQAAVDAASPGDTVIVRPGTYRESITIHTDGLTLLGHGLVTIEAPQYGSGQCYLAGHVAGFCILPADFNPVQPPLRIGYATSRSPGSGSPASTPRQPDLAELRRHIATGRRTIRRKRRQCGDQQCGQGQQPAVSRGRRLPARLRRWWNRARRVSAQRHLPEHHHGQPGRHAVIGRHRAGEVDGCRRGGCVYRQPRCPE